MKKLIVAVIGSLLMTAGAQAATTTYNDLDSFLAAVPGANLINFDVDTNDNPTAPSGQIGATYSSLGISFPTGNVFYPSFHTPVSAPHGWLNADISRFMNADITGSGITAIGVHNVGSAGTSTLSAYGAGDAFLGSVTSDAIGTTLDFFGLTTMSDILRIEVNVVGGGWGLDDLYIGPGTVVIDGQVPLPGAFVLMASGLAGFGALRARRKS